MKRDTAAQSVIRRFHCWLPTTTVATTRARMRGKVVGSAILVLQGHSEDASEMGTARHGHAGRRRHAFLWSVSSALTGMQPSAMPE